MNAEKLLLNLWISYFMIECTHFETMLNKMWMRKPFPILRSSNYFFILWNSTSHIFSSDISEEEYNVHVWSQSTTVFPAE